MAAAGGAEVGHEIRLAITMTGGVSLAIWMGGVARELNLLQQASDQLVGATDHQVAPTDKPDDQVRALYRNLLKLTGSTVNIDVLTGTSAGGINAALLGYCRAINGDLSSLRETWRDVANLETLIRKPTEPAPVSLLQGDAVMLTGLTTAVEKLQDTGTNHTHPAVDVFITTTLLSPETTTFTDDLGTQVRSPDHHGMFHFTNANFTNPATKKDLPAALALAARSSASFPGAFEPAFLPVGKPVKDDVANLPNMEPYSGSLQAHWAADGGRCLRRSSASRRPVTRYAASSYTSFRRRATIQTHASRHQQTTAASR
jgi:patatin-related protein